MIRFGKNILTFDTVTSTFDELGKLPVDEGYAVVAARQTAGVGRMGRQWLSDNGGLYFSFYIIPDTETDKIPFLALVCALAAYRTISCYTDCAIKWPNDIVADGKKVCGILTKSAVKSGKAVVMAGVGINVNNTHFDGELVSRAVSIKQITGKEWDTKQILNNFFECFEDIYLNLTNEQIIEEYSKVCATLGSDVAVHYNMSGDTVTGVCTKIRSDGSIDVKTADGEINVNSGEVSVRGIYGYI
ncbi:MAG: biotin--[acetyl-CoA-carboxylase] ligase [Ruminococcaceae bacterium]|nr:biotin--[acetyl-CoA-carboxylase] ligase [Oscillospiraceae bacterium]